MTVNSNTWMSSRWWYTLASAGIAYYLLTVIRLADNAPKFDDINDVFGFFKTLALARTPLQTVGAFFYPNNEHITLVNHLVYFAQQQLFGEIRFYPLILVGHCIIIATACLLGAVINNARRPFYFAAITIGYLNLYYWDSSFKAMTAISNQAVILFAVATFFSLIRFRQISLALLFAYLATFSQANGMLVWPLGLLALMMDQHWKSARWRYTSIWIIAATAAIVIFAYVHHVYSAPSPVTAEMVFLQWQKFPALPLLSTFAFLGSMAFAPPQAMLAIGVGAGALVVYIWLAVRHPDRNRLALVIAFFLLASAVTAGALRGMAYGDVSTVLDSRYKMYSVAFVLLALALWCDQTSRPLRRPVLAAALLITSLYLHASGYQQVPAIQQQAQQFGESYRNWLVDGDFRRQAVYFPPMSDHFLFVAEHLRLFDFMQLAPDGAILTPLPAVSGRTCPPTPAPADHCPMTIRHRGNAIAVAIDVEALDGNIGHQPALPANITLCDEQANVVMELVVPETIAPEHPASLQHWLIREADIPAGNYRVLFQPAQQPVCETQLTKKPRKVETEMRTLFGD